MRFYELPEAVNDALFDREVRPYVRVRIDGVYLENRDILDCDVSSRKGVDGGTVNRGELVADNGSGQFTELARAGGFGAGSTVEVWFCYGNDETCFLRFVLLVDGSGVQYEETGVSEKVARMRLVDYSAVLDNRKIQNNWEHKQTFAHCVVCDKSRPEKSLVHLVAARAGFTPSDIDCGYLPFEVPYVEVEKTAWAELCDLARCYSANLECTKEKPLIFTESPYDMENTFSEESGVLLTENEITHYRSYSDNGSFANSVRLKYTRYTETERQELWRYADAPFRYGADGGLCYPFTDDSREICRNGYEARYTARDGGGNLREAVYAEDVDGLDTFRGNIRASGGGFSVDVYDTTTYRDRAIIKLNRNGRSIDLYSAAIYGRAIISEQNFCVYRRDGDSVRERGQVVKNVTSRYLSDDEIGGVPFHERRVLDLLEESKRLRRSLYVTTSLCLCGARVGAYMDVRLHAGEPPEKYRITELDFYYKKNGAFVTGLWLRGE